MGTGKCTDKMNTCCAHGTKCNFGPSIDVDGDGKNATDVCTVNGVPNQCCVETDDGTNTSTKAIGFVAAKIPGVKGKCSAVVRVVTLFICGSVTFCCR